MFGGFYRKRKVKVEVLCWHFLLCLMSKMIQISTFPAAPSTERVPSLAERVASLRYSINLRFLNNRVPALVYICRPQHLQQFHFQIALSSIIELVSSSNRVTSAKSQQHHTVRFLQDQANDKNWKRSKHPSCGIIRRRCGWALVWTNMQAELSLGSPRSSTASTTRSV